MNELLDKTYTQTFTFGDEPEDHFFCLMEKAVNPDGLDIEEMASINPMRIEDYLSSNGCIIMVDGADLLSHKDSLAIDGLELHQFLIQLALTANGAES
jgi:hypothetical protein